MMALTVVVVVVVVFGGGGNWRRGERELENSEK